MDVAGKLRYPQLQKLSDVQNCWILLYVQDWRLQIRLLMTTLCDDVLVVFVTATVVEQ